MITLEFNQEDRHPRLDGMGWRYKHGRGGSRTPKLPAPEPIPTNTATEIQASKLSLRERLRRQRGQASTRIASASPPGSLTTSTDIRSSLG